MSKSTVQTDAERTPIMQRLLFFIIILLSGSCDALWGYTKIPTLEENCLAGDTVCKSYEVCSPETERCVQAVPQLTAVSPRVVFFDGGDVVTLTGDGFAPASQVFIDDQAVVVMPVSSAQSITAKIPKRPGFQGWGTRPLKIEVKVEHKSVARTDILSLVASTASFVPSTITGIVSPLNKGNLQVGDVNGDGKPDIVCRSAFDPGGATIPDLEFYISLGNGDGTFKQKVKAQTGSAAAGAFVLCDIDRDSKLDLVFWSNKMNIFQYSMSSPVASIFSSLATYTTTTPAMSNPILGVFDLDSNKMPDLLALDQTTSSLFTILSNGAGSLAPPVSPKTGAVRNSANATPVMADFNRDQKLDLITFSRSTHPAVHLGIGGGGVSTGTEYRDPVSNIEISDLAVGDFDNDGYPDFVTSSVIDRKLVLFKNNKGQGFDISKLDNQAISASVFLMITDLNGDSNDDIFMFEQNKTNPSGYSFMGTGTGTFSLQSQSVSTAFPKVTLSAKSDINLDGKNDLVFYDYGLDSSAYLIMNNLK